MIAVINRVLAGSFVGVLLAALSLPAWSCVGAGVGAFLLSVGIQQRYHWRKFKRTEQRIPALFPTGAGGARGDGGGVR
jgi:hypothetical protein